MGESKESKEKNRYPRKTPAGPSQREWNNIHTKWDGPVTCELCGTVHPESEEGYVVDKFLNITIVERCCGRVLDMIFRESGAEIAEAYLRDFADNPLSGEFSGLRFLLREEIIPQILKKIKKESGQIIEMLRRLMLALGMIENEEFLNKMTKESSIIKHTIR